MEKDILHTQTNVNETDNKKSGNELIQRKEVKESPFIMINEGNGWFAVLGDYKISETYETEQELEEMINKKDWKFLTTVISVVVEQLNKINK